MKKISFFSIMLLLMFVIGCQNQNTPIKTTNSSSTPLNTTIPTITLTPVKSPTLVSIASPTQTLSIQFPEWVKNPNTQILLIPVGTRETGYENMALYNAETGERFDVPFTEEVGDYFWMPDGSQFGFLPIDQYQVILFSIKDGTVNTVTLPDKALKFFSHNSQTNPVQVSSSNITDPGFLIIPSWYPLSPDRKYFEYQESYDNTYTSIFDISKNQIVNISDPNDGYFDLFSAWSPNSQFLAISEVDQEPGMYYHFDTLPTFRLKIYDIYSHEMITSYKNVTFPKWSPDGNKFLFQEWDDWFGESPPCVFDTISGTPRCYKEALVRHKTSNVIQTTFSSLQWSPDQTMVGYIYSNIEQVPYDEYGGFCVIILSSEESRCMLETLEFKGQKIIEYTWSFDSSFISFQYDTSCPYCDYSDSPKLAIANVKTGEYFSTGENMSFHYPGLWRPLSNLIH